MRRAVATSGRPRRPSMPAGLVGTAVLALLANLVLELTPLLVVHGQAWQYRSAAYPAMFALGFLVLWLLVGVIHALTGRLSVTVGVTACLTLALAYADYNKL